MESNNESSTSGEAEMNKGVQILKEMAEEPDNKEDVKSEEEKPELITSERTDQQIIAEVKNDSKSELHEILKKDEQDMKVDKEEMKENICKSIGTSTSEDALDAGIEVRSFGVQSKPMADEVEIQTEKQKPPSLVPVGMPSYMPVPMQMHNAPYPVALPVPMPLPIPIFVNTKRNSERGIRKAIRKIRALNPETLSQVADWPESDDSAVETDDNDDKESETNKVLEEEENAKQNFSSELTTALPVLDLESDIPAERIVPKPLPIITPDPILSPGPSEMRTLSTAAAFVVGQGTAGQKRRTSQPDEPNQHQSWQPTRGHSTRGGSRGRGTRGGRQNRRESVANLNLASRNATTTTAVNQAPKERPDAKHHLKFTYGVNAWKHWVVQKNAELEKARAMGKYMKTFETDILKLRADELIYTLCLFVKEVRKPNGEPYTPDSMLYLTLGIQEYLFENGRIDNIFTDMYYEPFTNALHEVVKDFKLPINDMGYFITRIDEEHLWESKQLGAHSPQVLLNTLIYFNTKYFLLKTVEQHKRLSFSHIMKHWKKSTPTSPKGTHLTTLGNQQKTILLRYYPPSIKAKPDDKRCLEQHENPASPLRCPVKLYEFYLLKCPESAKTRNDVFYLQPERSCVPDSPVWYSSMPLNGHQLDKMLQRLLMVKEIQELIMMA